VAVEMTLNDLVRVERALSFIEAQGDRCPASRQHLVNLWAGEGRSS
jgi:hypothetical protein